MKKIFGNIRRSIAKADKLVVVGCVGSTFIPVVGPVAKVLVGAWAIPKIQSKNTRGIKGVANSISFAVARSIAGSMLAAFAPPIISIPVVVAGAVNIGLECNKHQEKS